MIDTTILVLAKAPEPGKVKTRLSPPLTPEQSCSVHEACLRCTCASLDQRKHIRRILAISPDIATESFGSFLGEDWLRWPQGDGDLGARLSRLIEQACAPLPQAVLCLGADSPTLPTNLLDEALYAIARFDVVLGPCDDGGVYVIGVSKPIEELFADVRWGGEEVFSQLRQNALNMGASIAILDGWYDIDHYQDLQRARADLLKASASASRDQLLRVIESAL